MCRLLGWVSDQPRSLTELLPLAELAEFTELSRQHADGWGIAWYDGNARAADPAQPGRRLPGRRVRRGGRRTSPAPGRSCTCAGRRRACPYSPATPTRSSTTRTPSRTTGRSGPGRPARPARRGARSCSGDTDSELYLLALLQRVREYGFEDGMRSTIVDITADLTPSSLNAMLLGNGALTAMCCNIGDAGCPAVAAPDATAGGPAGLLRPALPPARRSDRWSPPAAGPTTAPGSGWRTGRPWCCPQEAASARSVPIGRYPDAAAERGNKKANQRRVVTQV